MGNLVTPDQEAGMRRDQRATILMTAPFKVTLQQISALLGMDMSDLVRQSLFEYFTSNYSELFWETYNRNVEYFKEKIR